MQIPKMYRAWINQPRTEQHLHHLHGVYCIVEDAGDRIVRLHFTEGAVHSMNAPRNCVSRIVLSNAEKGYGGPMEDFYEGWVCMTAYPKDNLYVTKDKAFFNHGDKKSRNDVRKFVHKHLCLGHVVLSTPCEAPAE